MGIIITKETFWGPARWVYDHVLYLTAQSIKQKDENLANMLLDSKTDMNGGFLSLTELNSAKFETLIAGAEQAFAQCEADGGSSFGDPAVYPAFLERFRELLVELRRARQLRGYPDSSAGTTPVRDLG